jgi:hypothetical protein
VAKKQLRTDSGLLKKTSCLAPALGVTKFTIVIDMILGHTVVLFKSDLDVQQTQIL